MLNIDPSRIKGTFIDDGGSVSGAGGAAPTQDTGAEIEGQGGTTGGAPAAGDGGSAVPAQNDTKLAQTPEQNKAFAELRRRAEEAERRLQQYNQTVKQHFGDTHGLHDLDSYFSAVGQTLQQQQAQQQTQAEQYRSRREAELEASGYNVKEIREIMRSDPEYVQMKQKNQMLEQRVAAEEKQRQQERLSQQIMSDHARLKEKYGDLVPDLKDIDKDTIALMNQGIPLRAAWLQANEDAILEHAKTMTKAKTLRDVGSKQHLDTEKGGGGDFESQVEIPEDQLKVWKSLFPGKKLSEYKQMASKYKKAAK